MIRDRLFWRRLVLPLALVLAVSAIGLVLLYMRANDPGRAAVEIEAAKAILYVLSAVLLGNIVLVIVRDFEERRKASVAERDLLRTDLTEGLLELYSRTKGTRRMLRANVGPQNGGIEKNKYDELLQDISDIQLGLERYKRQAEGAMRIGLLPQSVFSDLESMEKYLGKLVTEYETVLPSAGPKIELANARALTDFIGPYANSEFRSKFVKKYDGVARAVAEQTEKNLAGSKP